MQICVKLCAIDLKKNNLYNISKFEQFGAKFKHCNYRKVASTKGQLISKGRFGILNSPKKRTKKFDFTTMIPQVDLFSFVFWEKLKTPKRHFEIN